MKRLLARKNLPALSGGRGFFIHLNAAPRPGTRSGRTPCHLVTCRHQPPLSTSTTASTNSSGTKEPAQADQSQASPQPS